MADPVYVIKVTERKPQYHDGIRFWISSFLDRDNYNWWTSINNRTSFIFPNLRSEGVKLFCQLCDAIKAEDRATVENILPQLEQHTIKPYDEKDELGKWGDAAIQLPGDWGPVGENKQKLKKMITQHAFGRVLEAMCGFTSYFYYSPQITEVVALDFCEEALERYDYPERTRILYDLERVVRGERIEFFGDSSFQTVGVFFGVDYLTDPVPIYREFHRILSPNGRLLIVGETHQGYRDLRKRRFNPRFHSNAISSVGFSVKVQHLKQLKTEHELGEYYLVKGTNPII